MHRQPRIAMAVLKAADIPHDSPGVYALYRNGQPVYVGVAERQSLRKRLWGSHRGRGVSMTGSALRRNVAADLGIASATAIKKSEYKPTPEDARRVVEWIDGCEVTWIACASPNEAADLERDMKREFRPHPRSVNGHRFLPSGGHRISPLADMFSPRWWPSESPQRVVDAEPSP